MRFRTRALLLAALAAASLAFAPFAAEALTVSPPRFDFVTAPGSVIKDIIRIDNVQGQTVHVEAKIVNFRAGAGEDGSPEFFSADQDTSGHEMARWIALPSTDFDIPPSTSAVLPVTIRVPKDAQPGGHYAAVQLEASVPGTVGTAGGEISMKAATSVLFLLKVGGDVREKLDVAGFRAVPVVGSRLPVRFETTLANGGNTHLMPIGNLFISDWRGRQVASLVINTDHKVVLPDGARRFESSWGPSSFFGAFGPYTATLALTYGADNAALTATTRFWVIPWTAPALLAALALLILLLLVRDRKRRRR